MDSKEKKAAEIALERKCRFCGSPFMPKREWQRFCHPKHQKEYWKQVQNDKAFILRKIHRLEEKLGIE